jgi:predicted aspartyl protease
VKGPQSPGQPRAKIAAAGPFALGMALLLQVGALPAMADSACTSRQVASLPADFSRGDVRVDVGVNGQPMKFKIDSATIVTKISKRLVQRLGLPIEEHSLRIVTASETQAPDVVDVSDFKVGLMVGHSERFIQTDEGGDGTDGNFAGALGLDFLGNYDVELDPTESRVNLFLPIQCAGQAVYWWDEHFELPLTLEKQRIPTVRITLDGKEFTAYVDTSASKSRVDISVARRQLGVPENIEVLTERGGDQASPRPLYAFKELVFGPITLRNPKLELESNHAILAATGTHIRNSPVDETPIVIGMDILGKFHAMISRGTGKLYFTLPQERKPLPSPLKP